MVTIYLQVILKNAMKDFLMKKSGSIADFLVFFQVLKDSKLKIQTQLI